MISNRRERAPALYGKIRVLAGWQHLPPALGVPSHNAQRLLAAYLDRPLFTANFSAAQTLDAWSGRSLDDWQTFHQGGTRLVEYLQYVGYNGLMMSVVADGSTIYPSKVVESTPRYDSGELATTAQDPMRKDVLEMLFRLFDRDGLQLIPSLEFAMPLPELEAIRRRGGPEAKGIEWVGPRRRRWCSTYTARRGLAPYYNTLDPRVQDAMLAVVRELVSRYAAHPAFAGPGLATVGLRLCSTARSRVGPGRRDHRAFRAGHRGPRAGGRWRPLHRAGGLPQSRGPAATMASLARR